MRSIAAALVVGLAAAGSTPDPPGFVTVAQQDIRGTEADGDRPAISADGRYVAFPSYARLVSADANSLADLYVLDRATGIVTLESSASRATGEVAHPSFSHDGDLLVFAEGGDIILIDRRLGDVDRAARVLARGAEPTISSDGRFVAFVADGNIERLDLSTGTGTRAAEAHANSPSMSADGRYIAFASTRAAAAPLSLVRGLKQSLSRIYVADMQTSTTMSPAPLADGDSWEPSISGDGRFLAFTSAATNLISGDRNRSSDVFIADLRESGVRLVSRAVKNGSGNGASSHPAISADGRIVAFQSTASDLVCAARCPPGLVDINLLSDVFVLDPAAGEISGVSGDVSGSWMEPSLRPSLDDTGRVIAFSSRHPRDPSDVKNDFDLFILSRSSPR